MKNQSIGLPQNFVKARCLFKVAGNGMQLNAALCCACGKVAYRCCYTLPFFALKIFF